MRIDFQKLKKVEKNYDHEPICHNTLQTMVDIVLSYGETGDLSLAPHNVKTAGNSLIELGVLIDGPEKKAAKQLNS